MAAEIAKLFLLYHPGSTNDPTLLPGPECTSPGRRVCSMKGLMKKFILLIVIAVVALTGCNPAGTESSQAGAYCAKNGGTVETRYPFYDTNSPNPLQLEGSMAVCTFRANDQSRISVDLDTLYTDQPTLAALAYLTITSQQGATSPHDFCSSLGGADRFGRATDVGGGWAVRGAADVIALCVFPDLSAIDSQALTDHASGFIRGKDLTPLLRYKLNQSRKPFQ